MAINDMKIRDCVAKILNELGLDWDNNSMINTPARFTKYLLEFNQRHELTEVLGEGFEIADDFHAMVAQQGIPFKMMCEHHLLPATGVAAIGYVPHKRVVGISKLTRIVKAVGTLRPSLQEKICDTIADTLANHLEPKGVIVVIKAEHGCMACRGVDKPGILTSTSSVRGVFRDVPQARQEFFSIIGNTFQGG